MLQEARGRTEGSPAGKVKPTKSDRALASQSCAVPRGSKRNYSPELVPPLDKLHTQEIDAFFAGDPAAEDTRVEVRSQAHLGVGAAPADFPAEGEQEEEEEVVVDEEVEEEAEEAVLCVRQLDLLFLRVRQVDDSQLLPTPA